MIYFGSSTEMNKLSNLYESHISFGGNIYRSIEHIYQSLKFEEDDRHRFQIGGDLDNYESLLTYKDIFYTKNLAEDGVERKIKYWKSRRCVGIVPKMASNPKNVKKLGLTFAENEFTRKECFLIFRNLLLLKFTNNVNLKDILLSTEDNILVEFSRHAKSKHDRGIIEKWGGVVVDDVFYGKNWMGLMMMETRELLKANEE